MNGIAPGEDRRLRYIDTLRALAALLVVWRHVGDVFVQAAPDGATPGRWMQTAAQAIDVGHVGVIVFFLISGFVIPFSIHPGRPAALGSFVIKRFFRIFPAYWLSVPLGALTGYWIWGNVFTARDFAINLTLLQDLVGARSAEGLYWTLLVEWTFYALCIVLLLTRSLTDMRRICTLAFVLLAMALLQLTGSHYGWPTSSQILGLACLYLSIMLCGTLYRTCVVDGDDGKARWPRWGLYMLMAIHLVVLPMVSAIGIDGISNTAWISRAIGFAIFIAGTNFVRIATRTTDWLGRISYSIYLFHPVVFMALWWWLLRQPAASVWRTQHLVVYLIVNATLTIALADLVYRFVEKPGIALGHRLAQRWLAYRARAASKTAALGRQAATEPAASD